MGKKEIDDELQDACVRFRNDPAGFVSFMFDWGYGELSDWDGPDWWHAEVFAEIKLRRAYGRMRGGGAMSR